MVVTTSCLIDRPPEAVWPLLTHSEMTHPGVFCLGLPKPVRCELPDGSGGVGSERRCVSDRGIVIQRILEWAPPACLRFEMISTDHTWSRFVESLVEAFTLEPVGSGTKVTRRTTVTGKPGLRFLKEAAIAIGLKRVHLYVFKNWKHPR